MIELALVLVVIALATLVISWLPDPREVARRKGNSVYVGGDNRGVIMNGLVNGVVGSGPVITSEREVSGDFVSLKVDCPIILKYVQSVEAFLSVTAQENIVPLVEVEQLGRQLHIRLSQSIACSHPVTVELHGPTLSDAHLAIAGAFLKFSYVPEFDLTLKGAGYVKLEGGADRLALTLTGSGDIEATHLKASDVSVLLKGSGDISAWATNSVDVRLKGSGDIDIQGSPRRITRSVHGSGDIKIH